MKKNLISILILSTTFLSTHVNADEYIKEGLVSVSIEGKVLPIPSCILEKIDTITLPSVKADEFLANHLASTESKEINIKFTNCSDDIKNVKLAINKQNKSTLDNTVLTENNGSNVSIAILDSDNTEIDLSQEKPAAFKVNIDNDVRTANYTFFANYKKPANTEATSGLVKSTLTLDVIYSDVTDDGEITN